MTILLREIGDVKITEPKKLLPNRVDSLVDTIPDPDPEPKK